MLPVMATEIKLRRKYREVSNGSQKSSGAGHSGTKKVKPELPRGLRAAAQAQTKANQVTLVVTAAGKRQWVCIPGQIALRVASPPAYLRKGHACEPPGSLGSRS